jgi:hypothetical protein
LAITRISTLPMRDYANRALREGRLPEWRARAEMADSRFSQPDRAAAVFYPPNMFLSLWTDKVACSAVMDRLVFFHIMLLAIGAAFLARSLGLGCVGAVVTSLGTTLNGYVSLHLSHINIIEMMAVGMWPWDALREQCAAKQIAKQCAGPAARRCCFSIAILAGYPQMALYLYYCAALGGGALAIRRSAGRTLKGWALCFAILALGFAGAAVSLFPQCICCNSATGCT